MPSSNTKLKSIKPRKLIDPKYIDVPNICFSLTSKDDDREPEYIRQRLERGFDDSETWSLRDTIANFIIPRLKRHREIIDGFIVNHNELYENCDKALRAFELVARDNGSTIWTKEEEEEYKIGMEAFNKVFMGLWW